MFNDNRLITIIKLSRRAFGQYKKQIVILTVLGFLIGLLEGIGINALIPLFSFIVGQENGGDDFISQTIEKIFLYAHIDFNVKFLLIFISSLFIFKAFVLILFSYIIIKITASYEERTRNNLFEATLKADWPYLLEQKLGHLETILMINISQGSNLLRHISNTIMVLTSLIIYILVAINISIYITLITLILGLLLFLVFKPLIYRVRTLSRKTERLNKEISHYVNENIVGMKTIKAIFVGNKVARAGREFFRQLKDMQVKQTLLSNITGAFMQPVSLVFVCIVFALSYRSSNFNFAALVAVIYLIKQIFSYFEQLQTKALIINSSIPYLRNVLDYEDQAGRNKEKSLGSSHFKFNSLLEFRGVNFSYNPGKKILVDLNFNIKKGELAGLIGPSGVGKTTTTDLILRLFAPTSGEILLDGKNIKEINLEEWRKNIGYVSQDIFLINDTIANNIRFYDGSITDEDIAEAAKKANIYDFIQSYPNKFSTIIGERGVLLSAGQRQRIAIARVLARQPRVLLLDEATSALDNESEAKIQEVIKNLKGKITVLVIAHRLSTVINSDKLIVLDKGKIVEQGRPQELLKDKNSYFFKVYNIIEK
ncbi:MAG: ABC transporter ATP-binding protein [Patescibacteria group bacterium]|nr:ABC transporter ATP-binding protein [Patescibacteria group bacterium]